jgi:Uma2 family endonuclease
MSRASQSRVSEYLDLITHLPSGASLRLEDVGWDEYESLISALECKPNLRLTYRQGALEIMTPSRLHESLKAFITRLLQVLSEECEVELETCGSTTYKDQPTGQGTEPDECVYVGQPERILGKDRITLGVDPTPEIMIEIDVTHGSDSKLDIYANYGVPEIWLYAKSRMRFFELTALEYKHTDRSRYFPLLTADQLTNFMNRSQQEGQSKTLKAFREWLRSNLQKNRA